MAYLNHHSNDTEVLNMLGETFGYQAEWDQAIEIFSKLTELEPREANYYYKLGGSLGMKALSVNKLRGVWYLSDIKSALEKALELNPDHIEAHWALIEYYTNLPAIFGGSITNALEYANDLLGISKVDGYLAKGYIYEYDKDPDKAEFNYLQAVEVGGSITCYGQLSEFYLNTSEPYKAIQTIEKAQQKHQRNALHYQLGKVAADYNVQLDKGIQCLNHYIQNYTTADGVPLEWAYLRLAQIYKHKGHKGLSLSHIQKALELKPDFPRAAEEKSLIIKL
jgi:tetratricopeptide (TPR) repeat protein